MKNYLRAFILILLSIIFDIIGKIILHRNIEYVLLFEAILFLFVSLMFYYLIKRRRIFVRKVYHLELVLFYFYLLGSLRSMIIILGATVYFANLILFVLTIILILYHVIIKRVINANKETTKD